MSSYMIREVPPGLIVKAKAQAYDAGTDLDAVLIRFLETYAEHGNPQSLGGQTVMHNRTAAERRAMGQRGAAKRWGHPHKSSAQE